MPSLSTLISSLSNTSLSSSGPSVPLKRGTSPTSVTPDTPSPPSTPDDKSTESESTSTQDTEPELEPEPEPEPESEPDEIEVADWIQEYSDAKRLTPARANDLLEKAMLKDVPEPPDPDECCGSSCCPCVQDLWLEEVGVWHAVRKGEEAEDVASRVFKAKK